MPDRLTIITTRTGDDGSTSLGNGDRVAKTSARIAAIGDVDELNACIGIVCAQPVSMLPPRLAKQLSAIQHHLFDLGGDLAVPGRNGLRAETVVQVEQWILEGNAALGPLKEFILPGGSPAAAAAHICRTVCRRAERTLLALAAQEPMPAHAQHYLNRLSDLFFVAARQLNAHAGQEEVYWRPGSDEP